MQLALAFDTEIYSTDDKINSTVGVKPFKSQLLKWIGNKQRFAHKIISFFPRRFGAYHEPFLGSAAVLGVLSPKRAEAADCFLPLIEIWQTLKKSPKTVVEWYRARWEQMERGDKVEEYEAIKACYNAEANGADLLFLCRSCYGGVVRFRMRDGYMSTPCGIHAPIHPGAFARRVAEWHERVAGTNFFHRGYEESLERAREGDVVYCDPPYSYSQAILYGAQTFSLDDLFMSIERAKKRGAFVALSIDGSKKSGAQDCPIEWPKSLFVREVAVNVGRSMLRRFQMAGDTLEAEVVSDRLLLTY
jgi:DNA adenine methylase